ncbi:LamG-like jellyroll fold domain-containing protein [Paenibacillus sp. 2TAB26]|uniref:LamG-like jellyroll fold domain-containing protein n=1 Tax=Paenibacillus sp. 2TAB26 TaxID=3233005 RepID=UPI003F964340
MNKTIKKAFVSTLAAVTLITASGGFVPLSQTAFAAVVNADLHAKFSFENNAADSSTNNLTADIVGTPTYVPGRIGQALSLSSTSANKQYVNLGKPSQLQFGVDKSFSFSFWVKSSGVDSDPSILSNKDWNSGANVGYNLSLHSDKKLRWNFNTAGGTRIDADIPNVANGSWHHIVISHDRTVGRVDFYKDGVPVAVSTSNGTKFNNIASAISITGRTGTIDSGLSTMLGNDGTGKYSAALEAQLDEVLILNRAITPEEVTEIFNSAPPIVVSDKFNGTLKFVGATATAPGTEFRQMLDLRTPSMTTAIDGASVEIAYDSSKFTFSRATKATKVDTSTPGIVKLELPAGSVYNKTNPLEFASSTLSNVYFFAKDASGQGTIQVTSAEFFVGGNKYVKETLNTPAQTVQIKTKASEDINKDSHITIGDVALAQGKSVQELTNIADKVKYMPYKRVVVIGIDGAGMSVSKDAPYWETPSSVKETVGDRLNLPALRGIIEKGAASYSVTTTLPTVSSPNWGAMLNGVDYSKHQIDNTISANNTYSETSPYPSVFKKLREQFPETKLAAFTTWSNIINGHIEPSLGAEGYSAGDKANVNAFAKYAADGRAYDASLIFFQLDDVDGVGHSLGFYTKDYYAKLMETDNLVKTIYDSLGSKNLLDDTLILMTADHGGGTENADHTLGSATAHGQDSPLAKTVFIAANGRTIATDVGKEKLLQGGTTKDIAATILAALEVDSPIGDSKTIDGMFVPQKDQNKPDAPNLQLTKIVDTTSKQLKGYEFAVSHLNTDAKALDIELETGDLTVQSIKPLQAGVTVLRNESANGKTRIVLAADSAISPDQPIVRLVTQSQNNGASAVLHQAMIASGQGTESLPNFTASVKEEETEISGPTAVLEGKTSVVSGSTFTIKLGLNDVSDNVYAQDISFNYDPNAFEYVASRSLLEKVQIVNTIHDEKGKIRLILASEGVENAVTGSKQVVELTFKAKETQTVTTGKVTADSILISNGETEVNAAPYTLNIQVTPKETTNPADQNQDGKVSISDLALIVIHYGKREGSADWEQIKQADVNKDGVIDLLDLILVARSIVE